MRLVVGITFVLLATGQAPFGAAAETYVELERGVSELQELAAGVDWTNADDVDPSKAQSVVDQAESLYRPIALFVEEASNAGDTDLVQDGLRIWTTAALIEAEAQFYGLHRRAPALNALRFADRVHRRYRIDSPEQLLSKIAEYESIGRTSREAFSRLHVGMDREQVVASVGRPSPGNKAIISGQEIWIYLTPEGYGASVSFDVTGGKVVALDLRAVRLDVDTD